MQQTNERQKGFSYFLAIITMAVVFLGVGFIYLFAKQNNIVDVVQNQDGSQFVTSASGLSESEVQKMIDQKIAQIPVASSAPVSTTKPTSTPTSTPVSNGQSTTSLRTVYIPLGGTAETQGQNWVDLPNNEVYIDFGRDYGSKGYATWDVFLKVDQGNGQALARLFDVDAGTGVDGSEVSTANGKIVQVSSGQIKLSSGRHLYRVQIRSLNGYTAFIDSARIKITY